MDDEPQLVPSLSPPAPEEDATKPRSRSQARRMAAQRGEPAPTFEAPPARAPEPPATLPAPVARVYHHWKLTQDFDLYRSASVVSYPAGTIFSEQFYDIAKWQSLGAKLERLP